MNAPRAIDPGAYCSGLGRAFPRVQAGASRSEVTVLSVLVALLCILVFWRTTHFDFVVFDDDINIFRNNNLGVLTWRRLIWALTDVSYVRRYLPFGWLSYIAVIEASGLSPFGFHVANVIIHGVNAAILSVVLRQAVLLVREDSSRISILYLPAAASLWWGLHPLAVEIVAWSSGLIYNIATLFFLLAVSLYFNGSNIHCTRRRLIHTGAAVLYIASLLTYPIFLGGSVALLIFEVYRHLNKGLKKSVFGCFAEWTKNGLVYWVQASVIISGITYWASYQGGGMWPNAIGNPAVVRLSQSAYFVLHYAWVTCWPAHLSPVYGALLVEGPSKAYLFMGATGSLGLMVLASWYVVGKRWGVVSAMAAFLAFLAPFLPICSRVVSTSDRYAQPLLLVVAVALVLTAAYTNLRSIIATLAFIIVVLFWTPAAIKQTAHWENTDRLMDRALGEVQIGSAFQRQLVHRWVDFRLYYCGDPESARRLLHKANWTNAEEPEIDTTWRILTEETRFIPGVSRQLFRWACVMDLPSGDIHSAVVRLNEAVRWYPGFWEAHMQLADALLTLGRPAEAWEHFAWALSIPGSHVDPVFGKHLAERFRSLQAAGITDS